MKPEGLKTVLLRNAFYRDSYRRAVLALVIVLLVNIGLVGLITYDLTHPPTPEYFPATPDGRIINVHKLSDPVVSNDYVLQWAANIARKAYSLDFLHWQAQLQNTSDGFTPQGWKLFVASLKASNNLKTIIQYKMVSTAKITGAPQILEQEVIDGRYVWKVTLPIYITYTNGSKVINQSALVTMLVVRMPVWQDPDRIAVNNFIVNEQAS